MKTVNFLWTAIFLILAQAFQPAWVFSFRQGTALLHRTKRQRSCFLACLAAKRPESKEQSKEKRQGLSDSRRRQLGVADDEDEYDLGVALNANTDPLITKIIAGSAIVVIIALLVAGVIIPSLSNYGEGVCIPIQHGGRC